MHAKRYDLSPEFIERAPNKCVSSRSSVVDIEDVLSLLLSIKKHFSSQKNDRQNYSDTCQLFCTIIFTFEFSKDTEELYLPWYFSSASPCSHSYLYISKNTVKVILKLKFSPFQGCWRESTMIYFALCLERLFRMSLAPFSTRQITLSTICSPVPRTVNSEATSHVEMF